MDIKLVEHRKEKVSQSWLSRIADSVLGHKHADKKIKHIILDFASEKLFSPNPRHVS